MSIKRKCICIIAATFAIALGLEQGCDIIPQHPDDPNKDISFSNLPSEFIINENIKFNIKVNIPGWQSPQSVAFYLFPSDNPNQENVISTAVNVPNNNTPTAISFLIRQWPLGVVSNRTIPVLPGIYDFEAYVSSDHKTRTRIMVLANDYDGDSDDISDAVEKENNKTNGVGQTSITLYDRTKQTGLYVWNDITMPPLIPVSGQLSIPRLNANRGTHDYSIASDLLADSDPNSNASLFNGLRIAHSSTGYNYWQNTDAIDTDNWATLELINLIERVAREWNKDHPNYPLTTLDMSKQNGGYFDQHSSHQKGTSLDIYYVGTGTYDYTHLGNNLVLTTNDHNYDSDLNYELMSKFITYGHVRYIYTSDQTLAERSNSDPIVYLIGHQNHFHVEISDPDGAGN